MPTYIVQTDIFQEGYTDSDGVKYEKYFASRIVEIEGVNPQNATKQAAEKIVVWLDTNNISYSSIDSEAIRDDWKPKRPLPERRKNALVQKEYELRIIPEIVDMKNSSKRVEKLKNGDILVGKILAVNETEAEMLFEKKKLPLLESIYGPLLRSYKTKCLREIV